MVDLAAKLDKHLIPDLANIVLEYAQLEHVDKVSGGRHHVYTRLFGSRHGEYKCYYLTGELMFSSHWINSKPHGKSKGYYRNGELLYSSNWNNGKRHGEYQYFNPTGELINSHHYVNGVLQ